MKKYKLTFLVDRNNNWIEKFLRNFNFNLNAKYTINLTKSLNKAINSDIIFVMNYTKKISNEFLKKKPNTFLVHESYLPRDKGFAPVAHQILRGKRIIHMTLIKLSEEIDSGDIFMRGKFKLNGFELSDEIRAKQAISKLNLIKNFLIKYPKVKSKRQLYNGNFNRRLTPEDSQLDLNKSIKINFNRLRLSDNEKYPSFFYLNKYKYIIKIFRENKS